MNLLLAKGVVFPLNLVPVGTKDPLVCGYIYPIPSIHLVFKSKQPLSFQTLLVGVSISYVSILFQPESFVIPMSFEGNGSSGLANDSELNLS